MKSESLNTSINHLTSKVEVQCSIILVELIVAVIMMDYPRIPFTEWNLGKIMTLWNFKAGKSTSELRFVYEQQILRSL